MNSVQHVFNRSEGGGFFSPRLPRDEHTKDLYCIPQPGCGEHPDRSSARSASGIESFRRSAGVTRFISCGPMCPCSHGTTPPTTKPRGVTSGRSLNIHFARTQCRTYGSGARPTSRTQTARNNTVTFPQPQAGGLGEPECGQITHPSVAPRRSARHPRQRDSLRPRPRSTHRRPPPLVYRSSHPALQSNPSSLVCGSVDRPGSAPAVLGAAHPAVKRPYRPRGTRAAAPGFITICGTGY